MGDIVEGLMAVMGLTAGLLVSVATLVTGNAQNAGGYDSHYAPCTNHPGDERMAA